MPRPIADQATDFAELLTRILRAAVDPSVTFGVVQASDAFIVGPEPLTEKEHSRIPMRRSFDGHKPSLELRAYYRCVADDEGAYLAVDTSTLGLWICAAGDKARPAFRIEFDRRAPSKPQAHVHIHAESTELGWLYGSAGKALSPMQELHFPMGGRRFRPTIEEFLLFIDAEGLYTDWADPSWRQVVAESLDRWEQLQARATVMSFPEAAAAQLSSMGYTVTPPPKPNEGERAAGDG